MNFSVNPSSKLVVLAFFLIFSPLFSSCVTTRAQLNEERGIREDGDTQTTDNEVSRSSVQSEDLGTATPDVSVNTRSDVPATAGDVPQQQSPAVPPPAPVGGYSAEELRAEIARLNGKVDDLEHEKKLREEERTQEQQRLQEQVAGLEKQLEDNKPKVIAVPQGKTTFEAGKDAYFGSLYSQAVQYMDQFIQKAEDEKESDQKPDVKKMAEALYIRGESNFRLKEYKRAIVDFSKFPEKYQKSAYHPKALLRIAESFEAMGSKDDARAFYSALVEQFPKTVEGKLAQKRLKKK